MKWKVKKLLKRKVCYAVGLVRRYNPANWQGFKSDGQEISTIGWQELKNRFPSFFAHKQLLGR